MAEFRRCIHDRGYAALQCLAKPAKSENWWKDLLRLWVPSGTPSGEHGLRLAVRCNYLNFYAKGQSIARVGFDSKGQAYAETHVKYVFGEGETEQKYVRLTGYDQCISHPTGARPDKRYQGLGTLHEWIKAATDHSSLSEEKKRVEEIIGANAEIIDLEMGLPATGERNSALRMDCVALEDEGDKAKIVFWEAKLINDSRLRANDKPKVVDQIQSYRCYLGDEGRRANAAAEYKELCRLLVKLKSMAKEVGNTIKLHPMIESVASENSGFDLAVDPEPRLAILKEETLNKNWEKHEEKLRDKKYDVTFIILDRDAAKLYKPESKR